jgi:hypothetical protein
VKVELSGQRDHAEAAVCEGLLKPDDSAGIDTQQNCCRPPHHFPLLLVLPHPSWHNTRSVSLQGAGPDWFFKGVEATNASIYPIAIFQAHACRALGALPMLGGKKGIKCRREAWVARRKAASNISSSSDSSSSNSSSSPNSSTSI